MDWQWIRVWDRVHTQQVPLVLEEEDSSEEDGSLVEGVESLQQENGRQGSLVREGQGGSLAAVEMVAGDVDVHQQEDGDETVEQQGVIRPEQRSYPPLRRWPRVSDSQLLMRDEVDEVGAESLNVPAEDVIRGPESGQGEPRRGRGRGGRRGGPGRRPGRARGSSTEVSGGTRSGRRFRRT